MNKKEQIFLDSVVLIGAVIVIILEAPKEHWTTVTWAGIAIAGYLRLLANNL